MIILEFLDDFRDLELELRTHESGSRFIDGYNRGQPSNYSEPEKLRFFAISITRHESSFDWTEYICST